MHHFKLTIAYDGTDFHGWQMQRSKPTIQGEIVNVLERLAQEKIFLHGAGRTDAGVHALGQVASFKTQSGLSAQEFQRALNALLPPTIRIVGAEEVGPDFHARWSARRKTYRYRLYRGRVVPPTRRPVLSARMTSLRSQLRQIRRTRIASVPQNVRFIPQNSHARPMERSSSS